MRGRLGRRRFSVERAAQRDRRAASVVARAWLKVICVRRLATEARAQQRARAARTIQGAARRQQAKKRAVELAAGRRRGEAATRLQAVARRREAAQQVLLIYKVVAEQKKMENIAVFFSFVRWNKGVGSEDCRWGK